MYSPSESSSLPPMPSLITVPPQLAHRVIVINATSFARYAWASIGFFFASDTFNKIVVRELQCFRLNVTCCQGGEYSMQKLLLTQLQKRMIRDGPSECLTKLISFTARSASFFHQLAVTTWGSSLSTVMLLLLQCCPLSSPPLLFLLTEGWMILGPPKIG